MAGLRIDADFTEETVGIALQIFLTRLSFPRNKFTIESFSRAKERWLGADARLDGRRIQGFRTFYMQFKRPSAYPYSSRSKVIEDRKNKELLYKPNTLFFELRNKTDAQWDYQHNVLFRLNQHLNNRGLGRASYVCPLFLDRSAYINQLHWSGLSRWARFWEYDPWDLESVLINHQTGKIQFSHVPTLVEHVSIPPHDRVDDANHRYSFYESGKNLCFHSPTVLPDGVQTLANFLESASEGFIEEQNIVTQENAYKELMELVEGSNFAKLLMPNQLRFDYDKEDPIGSWLVFGDSLRRNYDIHQYAFVKLSDE